MIHLFCKTSGVCINSMTCWTDIRHSTGHSITSAHVLPTCMVYGHGQFKIICYTQNKKLKNGTICLRTQTRLIKKNIDTNYITFLKIINKIKMIKHKS